MKESTSQQFVTELTVILKNKDGCENIISVNNE